MIKETKELLKFGFSLIKGITASLEDKKITLGDYPNFLGALMSAGAGFGGIEKVAEELSNRTHEETKELLDFARAEFDLPNDKLEILIEDTLEKVLGLYDLAIRWKNNGE